MTRGSKEIALPPPRPTTPDPHVSVIMSGLSILLNGRFAQNIWAASRLLARYAVMIDKPVSMLLFGGCGYEKL